MSTVSQPQSGALGEHRRWTAQLVGQVWASLAITTMWVAVAVAAVWGPDLVSNGGSGGGSTTIPSGVVVAFFACIASWVVAKYSFRSDRPND